MNKHDSERIAGILISEGYKRTTRVDRADIVIFNTCCVRRHAEDRLFGNVNSLKALKKKRDVIIAVGGCLAQKRKEEIFLLLPHVDLIFGTHNISNIASLVKAARRNGHGVCEILECSKVLPTSLPIKRESMLFAWLPVSIGCNNFCSYCVVPFVRGREVSLPLEEIKREAQRFVLEGAKEITLLGQNVNSYGRDLYKESRFDVLLRELDKISGLERIRFTTSHPKDLNEKIIAAMSSSASVCEHIHLPLQAGSDRILKLMNREYTQSEYLKIIQRIRPAIPECSITTDIIVGFPGETEEDFQQTLEVVNEVHFDQAFMFIYSARDGTPAASMEGQVSADIKADRFSRLLELQNKITWEENKKLVDRRFEILVEGISKRDEKMLFGRTRANKVVNFIAADMTEGTLAEVRVVRAGKKSLIGELVIR